LVYIYSHIRAVLTAPQILALRIAAGLLQLAAWLLLTVDKNFLMHCTVNIFLK